MFRSDERRRVHWDQFKKLFQQDVQKCREEEGTMGSI